MDITRRKVLEAAGTGAIGSAMGVGTATGQDGDESPGEYIVGVEPGQAEIATARATQVTRTIDFGEIGQAVAGQFSESERRALQADGTVRYIEPNGRAYGLAETTPYGIELTEADTAIDLGNTGDGVDVAIVDSGIDPQHEALASNLGEGWAASSEAACGGLEECPANDIQECLEPWDDDHNHGTHVAGTAGAAMNDIGVVGVAPDVTLHAVKVLKCTNFGTWDDIAAGIEWAARQGHDVINMSIGGDESTTVSDAIEYAASQGAVLVASASNEGPCEDCVSFPATHPEVIAVSAVDQNDDLAQFSSTGPEVDIAAPGNAVYSTIPRDQYADFYGTSMASPHVAGAAAQLIASGTTDRDAVRQKLMATAEDIGLSDNEQGNGRLNVALALNIANVELRTDAPTEVGGTGATLNGTVQSLENTDSVDVSFEYGKLGEGLPTATDPITLTGSDTVDTTISGLTDGTTYEVRAVAETGEIQERATTETFTTVALPDAAFTVDPSEPSAGEIATFDASGSSSPEGEIVEYRWNFTGDDGTDLTTTDPIASYAFDTADDYDVTLTVVDDRDETASVTKTITVTQLEEPLAQFSLDPVAPAVRETVTFDASDSVSPDGDVVEYRWDFIGDGEIDQTVTNPVSSYTYTAEGTYSISLTIVDDAGQTATASTSITAAFEVDSYAGDDGAVETGGLRTAVADWQTGDIGSRLLADVIESWSSGR